MTILDRIGRIVRLLLLGGGPKSLMTLAKEPRPKSTLPTAKLYVIETDFEITPDSYNNLQAMLDVVREKYGLDFLILESGCKLKRFDDY